MQRGQTFSSCLGHAWRLRLLEREGSTLPSSAAGASLAPPGQPGDNAPPDGGERRAGGGGRASGWSRRVGCFWRQICKRRASRGFFRSASPLPRATSASEVVRAANQVGGCQGRISARLPDRASFAQLLRFAKRCLSMGTCVRDWPGGACVPSLRQSRQSSANWVRVLGEPS